LNHESKMRPWQEIAVDLIVEDDTGKALKLYRELILVLRESDKVPFPRNIPIILPTQRF
jgi:hypothetical protein